MEMNVKQVKTIRSRYAPSPTGFMQLGNLRTALYEYLIAKHHGGTFILRIEDTDAERFVEGAVDLVYETLKLAGIQHDEGPDVGGAYGPYVQSERKANYLPYAEQLIEKGHAYYCFCTKDRLDGLRDENDIAKYDRYCLKLSKEEGIAKINNGEPYVIRQLIPEGSSTFTDEVFGEITIENKEIEDQVLIKSDGMPTYNFANVIDDHLMEITHAVRGCEYLTSTPKYNLLYDAFGWERPAYVHLPLLLNADGKKISKRNGDKSFKQFIDEGYLPHAIVNYTAFLGWSPPDNTEFFTMKELEAVFTSKGISKSPAKVDEVKMAWMNGEYIKRMDFDEYYAMVEPTLKLTGITDTRKAVAWTQTRVQFIHEAASLLDFLELLPEYTADLYINAKMKIDGAKALSGLNILMDALSALNDWTEEAIHACIIGKATELEMKNGLLLSPFRTALSGQPTSPAGGVEIAVVLGKDETLNRIQKGIKVLTVD